MTATLEERISLLPIELQHYIDEYNVEHRIRMKLVLDELHEYMKQELCELSSCNRYNSCYKMYGVEMYYGYYKFCSCDCMVNGINEKDMLYDYNEYI